MSLTKVSYSMITGSPVNVLDYGADSTGGTDSRAAIQAAIDAAMPTNGAVYIPNGTYLVSATLNCRNATGNSVSIIGETRLGTIISSTITTTTPVFKFANSTAAEAWGSGVQNVTIKRVGTKVGIGISCEGVVGTQVTNVTFSNLSIGLALWNTNAGDYTEQIKFNETFFLFCDRGIQFQKFAGDPSFHGCGGSAYMVIDSSQIGIEAIGAFIYNTDIKLDAVGFANNTTSPVMVEIKSASVFKEGTAKIYIEDQTGGPGCAFNQITAGSWAVDTVVAVQGGLGYMVGTSPLNVGFSYANFSDVNDTNSAVGRFTAKTAIAAGASIIGMRNNVDGGLLLIRNSTSGGVALAVFESTGGGTVTIITDTNSNFSTTVVASKIRLYFDTGVFKIQNNYAASQTVTYKLVSLD